MTLQVEVNGKVWYVADNATYNEVVNAYPEEQEKLLKEYKAIGKASTNEDDLQEVDEDESTNTSSTASATNSTSSSNKTSNANIPEVDSSNVTYAALKEYYSELSNDSSVDAYYSAYQKVEKYVEDILDDINSTEDVSKLNKNLSRLAGAEKAVNTLSDKINNCSKQTWQYTDSCIAAGIMGVGSVVAASTSIGAQVGTALGTVVPGLGNIIGGAAGAVGGIIVGVVAGGIYGGIKEYNIKKDDKNITKMQEGISKLLENVEDKYASCADDAQTAASKLVDETSEMLEGLLGSDSKFNFEDVTDTLTIYDNIEDIIKYQGELEPWYELCQTYGIEVEGLDDLMEQLGSGDDSLQYAQDYLDSYADKVSIDVTGDVITDTVTLQNLCSDIIELREKTGEDGLGLNTDRLTKIIIAIASANQDEIESTAENAIGSATSGGTVSSAAGNVAASNTAGDTASTVADASSSYDTDTSSLETASEELLNAAQEDIAAYLASISTEGLTSDELSELYDEVLSQYQELADLDSDLDLSGFETTLSKIEEARVIALEKEEAEAKAILEAAKSSEEEDEDDDDTTTTITVRSTSSSKVEDDDDDDEEEEDDEDDNTVTIVTVGSTSSSYTQRKLNAALDSLLDEAEGATTSDELWDIIDELKALRKKGIKYDLDVDDIDDAIDDLTDEAEEMEDSENRGSIYGYAVSYRKSTATTSSDEDEDDTSTSDEDDTTVSDEDDTTTSDDTSTESSENTEENSTSEDDTTVDDNQNDDVDITDDNNCEEEEELPVTETGSDIIEEDKIEILVEE